jgi:hypothetical protein
LLKYYTRPKKKEVELRDIKIETVLMSPVIIHNFRPVEAK